jgi:hypothetical protein
MDSFLASAHAEERRLTDLLGQDPLYAKLVAVRAVIAAYEASGGALARARSGPLVFQDSALEVHVPVRNRVRPDSKTQKIAEVIKRHLQQTGRRETSGQLMKVMTAEGIEVGGAKPNKTLASYLSNMKGVTNVPGQGYGLAEWGPERTEGSEAQAAEPSH